ncbi:MAG: heme exporter protein CcmB [Meiothermus sp.]|uniref:heme exporter protein CcmB n=1 Tax=Meiothermus sp. TaxID=1955249 RepID=UPI0025E85960|nr:heme exporter protein CcmB [Meiothermus sp.]MCS7058604.1 heme exporter protein CcmB [Meiothermus sp.]MCS7193785.1 heme exporter protein CcmB [Meiothermus sp.]MCX7739668.1 heme exporter protein CcmB [Meiothermus sp.]MDW8091623.1 heme exporter protein CcmB [Meiothermus sp.]MDW8481939.1 heme exporter protein CcmB [Meiothermus sp.]
MGRILWLAWRDLTLELRGRTGLLSAVFFLAVMLLILAMAFGPAPQDLRKAAPGALWVALAFAGSLLAGRAFGLEVEDGTLDDLLLTPGGREWIYFGKLLFQLTLLTLVGLVLLLLAGGLFYLPLQQAGWLLAVLLLGALGYAAVSTFYAGMLARLRGREVLLPLLLFPLVVPVVLAAVRFTQGLAEGLPVTELLDWLRLLMVFDAIYVAACAMLFPLILEG